MSNDLLEKVITTTQLGSDEGFGLLNPEQTERFITYMWDATVIGNETRKIRMRSDTVELDRIAVGERILRVATEAVDDHVNVHPVFTKVSLGTSKLRLDWELSTESLEDNIEGDSLEDTVARLMAGQIGNDMEDLAINGDSTSPDTLMRAFDGYRKQALQGHVLEAPNEFDADGVDTGQAVTLSKEVFAAALKAMPRKFMQRRNLLRFYAGSNLVADYLSSLIGLSEETTINALRGGEMGNPAQGGGFGQKYNLAFGVPVFEVPLLPENLTRDGTDLAADGAAQHGTVELTFPQNRIWGVKREIKVYREFKPKKDTIEYTVFTRVGAAIENPEAYVTVNGVRVKDWLSDYTA